MLAAGLLTRITAAAVASEMTVVWFAILSVAWDWAHHGMRCTLMMGIFAFAMTLCGNGPYSVDRLIGTEL